LRVGYVRVSTVDQNTARQYESLAEHKLDRIFCDKLSGKDIKRPELELMMQFVREGDEVYCHSLDRLSRSLVDLLNVIRTLTDKGVKVTILKTGMGVMTFSGDDNPMAVAMLGMTGVFAQLERDLIRERIKEGIAIKKAQGGYTGRKPTLPGIKELEIIEKMRAGENITQLARTLGMTRDALYKIKRRHAK
jgi:DNA invertase Pin-like site-specific DNA recombinase